MITRQIALLVVGLSICAIRAQYVPLSSAGDDNDCALYLSGPGRSSAFDYNLNLLRGSFPYDGQHTCITYDAINGAYVDARKRINVASPKGDWKTEDIASVGELMLDISISLARTYGLTYEDIEKGLPLIDTSKTLIREVCPPFLSHVECRAGKYRRFDGLCTNLQHPTWGASMTPFQRLIAPLYADGINAPRISVTGRDLPLSRIVSRTMHPDEGFHDHAGTVMVIAWGQFMDHDYTLTGTPLDPFNRNDPEECCNRSPHQKHPYCNELIIPDDDYFYRLFNIKCIDFVRGFPHPRAGCRLGSRAQFNTLTGVLDGNTVYGVTEKFARKLRSGYGGLLRMNPVFEEYGLRDLLPLKLDIPDEGCTRPNKSMYCFEAGEIRVNEQLVLTCMHTLMAREHNRAARGLAQVNPHWDDETLFQEARRIVIAEIQHITYNEFLPILLGKEVMEKFGLLLQKEGHWDGYDENINPGVIDAFAAAAFRFGHSLLPTAVERWSKAHKFIASKRLSDLIRRPYDLYRAGVFDEYLMGLMNQVAQAMDDSITQEVTNHLFKKPGARFGMDLVSFNMQRGREFGLPGYMEFRKFCGLPGASSFQELFGSMPNETIQRYESIFDHPSDVDLWSGGVSERPLPGSMLGPTFACVIATQFSYSRRGDRFWYELPNQPSSFTPEQLIELRKARLSRIICDNTDIIDTVQIYPMVLPDHEINPRVPCKSGIIPSIDFSKWADYSGHRSVPSNPYELETEAVLPNSTDNNRNKTEFSKKSTGHYKNALRRRRSVLLNDTLDTNGTKTLRSNDSQAEAIIISQVTGSLPGNNDDIVTTEIPVPHDQREETSPQTFIKREHYDPSYYQDYKKYFDIDKNDKVSQQDQRENLENEDSNVYNHEDFIPDEEKTTDNKNVEREETDSEQLEHSEPENNNNEELPGDSNLEFQGDSDGDAHVQDKSADESHDLNKNYNKQCVGDSGAHATDDNNGRSERLIRRNCEDNSKSLDWVNNNNAENDYNNNEAPVTKHDDEELNDSDDVYNPENAKEQFEFIPLDYSHDVKSAQNETADVEKPKFPFNIELGDTTVELDNITLPESVFGFYKSEFTDRMREKDKNDDENDKENVEENDNAEENDNDEESNDDKKGEHDKASDDNEETSTDTPNNEEQSDDEERPFYFTDNNDEDFIPGYVEFDSKLAKTSEALTDDENKEFVDHYIQDPELKSAVGEILQRSKKTENEAGGEKDPKYNYFWTLEYGQPV